MNEISLLHGDVAHIAFSVRVAGISSLRYHDPDSYAGYSYALGMKPPLIRFCRHGCLTCAEFCLCRFSNDDEGAAQFFILTCRVESASRVGEAFTA